MSRGPSETAQLYVAGLANADWELMFKSAAVTAIVFAIASASAVLYLYRKGK